MEPKGHEGWTPFLTDTVLEGLHLFNLRRKYHEISLRLRSEEVDPFGYDPVFDRFISPVFDLLYQRYWRIQTSGLHHVPTSGPGILVGNHSGSLPYDATMLKHAISKHSPTGRTLRFMVEDFLYHQPFLGSFMNRFGGVRACPENAQQLLEGGHLVGVFPEGVKGLGKLYRNRYRLDRFGRGGFVRLALVTGAPIVPVAIIGAEEIHPMLYRETHLSKLLGIPYLPVTPTFPWLGPLGLIPLPSKWSIHILEPIHVEDHRASSSETDRVVVSRLTLEVKRRIQAKITEILGTRPSPWR